MNKILQNKLNRMFLGLFLFCIILFNYYIFKNIFNTYNKLPTNLLFTLSHLSNRNLLLSISLVLATSLFSYFTRSANQLINISFWFTISGIFTFFTLILTLLGKDSIAFFSTALALTFILITPILMKMAARIEIQKLKCIKNPLILAVLAPALYMFVFRLLEHLINASFYKEVAIGDEKEFWFSALSYFYENGFSGYFKKINGGYDPGYVFFNFPILKAIGLIAPSSLFLAPLFMFCAFLMIFIKKSHQMSPTSFFFWASSFAGLFLYHDWLNVLLFQVWYGEALALIATYWLYELIDQCEQKMRLNYVDIGIIFSFGVMSSLIKPPMSFLFLPCVLPAFFLIGIILRKNKNYFVSLIILFFGALLAKICWKMILHKYAVHSYYTLSASDFMNFKYSDGSLPLAIEYLFANYKPIWLPAIFIMPVALFVNFKKYLSVSIVTLGLVLSIALLYATRFSNFEHESSGRYLIQCLMPLYLFSIPDLCRWAAENLLAGKNLGRDTISTAR